ncbi:hypothetical protein GGI07_000682, partial [Coemansia sp. Benny D115]
RYLCQLRHRAICLRLHHGGPIAAPATLATLAAAMTTSGLRSASDCGTPSSASRS